MVGSKRSSKGSKFSMKTTPANVSSGGPPLGFKKPPILIGEKTIDRSVIALRAKKYATAYADPSMRQKWNMYVSFGIQQFLSPQEYLAHRAQETTDGRNLRLARYYRHHLEQLAPIKSYLIRTVVAVETALASSHPGYFDMSTNDMDTYMASLSETAPNAAVEAHLATTNTDVTMTTDDAPAGSSLAVAAAKSSHVDNPTSGSQEGDEYQTQEDPFIAVPVAPKRSNKSAMEEETDDTTPMDTSTTDTTILARTDPNLAMNTPTRAEKTMQTNAPIETAAATTTDEYFGVPSKSPIPPCNTTNHIVNKQRTTHETATSPKRRRGGRKKQGTKANARDTGLT